MKTIHLKYVPSRGYFAIGDAGESVFAREGEYVSAAVAQGLYEACQRAYQAIRESRFMDALNLLSFVTDAADEEGQKP